ncbi:glycosyltransferase family 4 protein [Amnibacterium kyonggiense]|uniref:D-inositol 3-phosphate glycosyltransferase n=1 Tax=Amnibacterium kyonggiense TaxID=595671 RepID=A0A4R7FIV3_9MICO|nr:glycosyltransferase [Amnibacterium kyonggiense]TDS74832.1 glycosyltransferase involved in cell wall biosynthesis [Amnibacterium kyonggiense]
MNGRPIRVLQVVQRFAPELGGLETHVAEVTRRLAGTEDVEITVLTTDRTGRLPREDRIGGVRVIRRRSYRRSGEEYFAPGIVRVIRRGGWDLVHVQGSQTTVPTLAMLAARSAGIPYVLTFHSGGHSSAAHAPITRVQNAINRPLLRRAARLVAVSRFERARFARILGLPESRFTVIRNGGALPPVPTGAAPVRGSIVTSGRLERYKGHHRVIAALPLIRAVMPEATVTVLGSGPYEPELRRLVEERGVAEAVTFRHLLPAERAEMAAVLSRSSVMAALSSYEAHPVAVMEAVALGLPVVGFDTAGIGDLVEEGLVTGVPLDADDATVAEALLRRLRQDDGTPHRGPDVELPTWEGAAAAIADVYRSVLGSAAPRSSVVQIITTLTTGGAERQVESIVDHSRHRQHVIALYGGGTVARSLEAAGHSVEVLDLVGPRRLLALPVLVRRLQALRPDTVQVHLLSGQLWGLPAARLARVPVVLSTEHSLMDDSIENRPLSEWLRRLYLALNRLATRTVAVSAATADRLVRWGVRPESITVIDNGIDFARLAFDEAVRAETRRALDIRPDVEVVGAVGRLEPVKRMRQLLSAVAPTLERGRRELLIVGDGPLRAALAAEAASLGVADAVHLTGPRQDVPALLSAMDVLVSASRDETFGMAVLEGIGAGLPVVHAQCPALDALPAPVPGAFPIGTSDDRDEPTAVLAAVERALAVPGRLPVPAEVLEAYDIVRTTARLDRLVDDGARRGRGRR